MECWGLGVGGWGKVDARPCCSGVRGAGEGNGRGVPSAWELASRGRHSATGIVASGQRGLQMG